MVKLEWSSKPRNLTDSHRTILPTLSDQSFQLVLLYGSKTFLYLFLNILGFVVVFPTICLKFHRRCILFLSHENRKPVPSMKLPQVREIIGNDMVFSSARRHVYRTCCCSMKAKSRQILPCLSESTVTFTVDIS